MKRLLIDMSSLMWRCLLEGRDTENGVEHPPLEEGKRPVWVNSAEHGMENAISSIVSLLKRFQVTPHRLVLVYDGKDAKALRQAIDPNYKAGSTKHPATYEQFSLLRERLDQTLLDLGAIAVEQQGREADDVLAYLAMNLKTPHVIVSNDGDLLALQGGLTEFYTSGDLNVEKYGVFPAKYITLYKALVGDPSDNIKGAAKFGPKTWLKLYVTFGDEGLELMQGLITSHQLDRLAEDVPQMKELQRIIDDKDAVYRSWACALMYPEKVNTARQPMQIRAGMVKKFDPAVHDERLRRYYGMTRIIHAENYVQARGWAMEKLLESPFAALDIETSTPPESDEWLEAKNRAVDKKDDEGRGVDVWGSELTGLGLTFGDNLQYSFYFTVDHVAEPGVPNLSDAEVRKFVELIPRSKPLVIQNTAFELPILHKLWGEEWKDNGWRGFLPNVHDTKVIQAHVDENGPLGLKKMSKAILGYDQMTYGEVTQGRKMNEMTARETVGYGLDDTICTAAIYNYQRFVTELEDTWKVYEEVEIKPHYLNAYRFVCGTKISLEKMRELQKLDEIAHAKAWVTLRDYLIAHGWEGTVCPRFVCLADFTPARIKEAYLICTGQDLETQVRTPQKLFALMRAAGEELLPALLERALESEADLVALNSHLKNCFKGEPALNMDSPKQMARLLYETLALPVRVRNKLTPAARAGGAKEGSPRTDHLALEYALTYDREAGPEVVELVKALQTLKTTATREKMFYKPYKHIQHWKDELVHPEVNQSAAATRRYTSSNPNMQQLPKHPKQGVPSRFREVYVPHKVGAVVVSLDFNAQELRVIADRSKDPNMLACYVGDNKKDMHSITGVGIFTQKKPEDLARMTDSALDEAMAASWLGMTYEKFEAIYEDASHPDHKLVKMLRNLGKKTNFTTEYGAQAPKLAETLIIEKGEAQQYIDAKLEAFPRAETWKKEMIALAHRLGYGGTMMGARRHLPDLMSSNKFDVSKAERQAVNNWIQGSCAEMTKLAEGRVWESGVLFRYDSRYIGPIHDELVFSVMGHEALPFIAEVHKLMTMSYADMAVPIVSSISLGPDFGRQIEVGDDVIPEAIEAAIAKSLQLLEPA